MVAEAEHSTPKAGREAGQGLAAHLSALEPLLVAPDEGLFLFSPTFTYLYVNAAGAAMAGFSADDLLGDSFIERFPAVVDGGIAASMRLAMESGEAQHFGPFHYEDGAVTGDFEHLQIPVPDGVLVLVKRLDDVAGAGVPITLARTAELARRQAELSATLDALRERDAELLEAQRIAGIGSATWDATTDSATWTAEMYDLFGLDPEGPAPGFSEAMGLFTPESRARLRVLVANAMEAGDPYEEEFQIDRPDGTRRTLVFRGEPRRDASGAMVGSRFVAYDVTDRRETVLLRAREAELAEAQRISQIGSWTWDPARDVGTWSEEQYRIHGVDPSEPVPSFAGMAALVTPATFPALAAAVERAMATGESYEVDIDIVRPDGSIRQVVDRGEAVRDGTGAVVLLRGTFDDLTEWRGAERRFRALFHNSPLNGVIYRFVRDEAGEIVDWEYVDINALGAGSTGLPADQLVGRRMSEVVGADVMAPYIEVSREIARSGTPRTFETHFAHDDRDYLSAAFLLGDDQYAILSVDTTDRARAYTALRESEADYRSLFAHMQEGLAHCRIDRVDGRPVDWTYLAVNEAFERQSGLRGATGRRVSDLVPGIIESDPGLLETYGRVASGGGPERFETHVEALDAWFDVSVYSPTPDEFVAVFDVITERKRAEEDLRARAARDALLVDASADGIFRIALPRGRFIDANPAACAIFGHPRDELLGLDILDLVETVTPGDTPVTTLEIPPDALAGGIATLDRVVVRADGSRTNLSARMRLLPDGTILVNARDQTREHALEQQVEQAQRMESVGRLAGGIAHDFNNLLMTINGYASLVLEALPPADPLRPDVEAIREAGDRGAALTRQLLAFGRRQTLQPSAIDVGSVVAGLRSILTRLLGEDVTLHVRTDPGIGPVWADRSQLEQVIVNLVTNARDAMPDGGAIAIETTEVEMGPKDPRLRPQAAPGRYVRLAVTDTGGGMDDATIAHIFEPFFTTKSQGRGTGLGLSTVEGVVAQSGGFITVESRMGRGTTFDVFLPRTAPVTGDPAPASAATPSAPPSAPRGTETILLVEDEPGVRVVAARMLRDLGYEVIEATGPTQALVVAGSHSGPIDLLVTDVIMPEMNGRILAERLAADRADLAVLFMSGYSPESVFRDGYLDEQAAYLRKPFSRDDLATKVRSLLEGRRDSTTVA